MVLVTCALLDTGFQASSLAFAWVDEVAGALQMFAALVPEENEGQVQLMLGEPPAAGLEARHGPRSAQKEVVEGAEATSSDGQATRV